MVFQGAFIFGDYLVEADALLEAYKANGLEPKGLSTRTCATQLTIPGSTSHNWIMIGSAVRPWLHAQ